MTRNNRQILNSDQAYRLVKRFLKDEEQEQLIVVLLSPLKTVKAICPVFSGTEKHVLISDRMVARLAVVNNADSVILAHNHPSGDPRPSQKDIEQTHKTRNALSIFDIRLLDHIIVGDGNYYSFAQEKAIQEAVEDKPSAKSNGATTSLPGIPDLRPMYESVRDFVRDNQGEKGYIDTQDEDHDTIWAFIYTESENNATEVQVKAVRVDGHGNLQVVVDDHKTDYSDEDLRACDNNDRSIFGRWTDVWDDDNLYFIPTIFNLAEFIREYAEN